MVNHEIICRLRDGDPDALVAVYDSYKAQIMNYCKTMVLSRENAEELVNDIFHQLYEKRKYIDTTRDIKPYLFAIAKNTTYNWLNKTTRHKKMRAQFEADYKAAYYEQRDMKIDFKMDLKQLEEKLGDMPTQRQLIFKMCKFQEMTYAEVAQALCIKMKTVENQMGLANKQFAKIVSRSDYVYFALFLSNIFFG